MKYTYDVDPSKIADVEIEIDGKPEAARVAISQLPEGPDAFRIFGLCAYDFRHGGFLSTEMISYMSYGSPTGFDPQGSLDWCDLHGVPFPFDAGTTRPKITISRRELAAAFITLGMIEGES